MARNAEVKAVITAEDRASKTLNNVGKSFGKVLKVAAVGAAAASAAVGAFAYKSVKAFQEEENAIAQLNAVLKSTKGIAGVTAQEATKLASSLQKVTTFGDEAIIGGQSLLLTFTKIGKDIFPQATETMLDMSQALGQDMKSSAIQLGKALQDPILGVTALRRVGVNFNDEQKEVIKNLVETGRAAEAQKMILEELATEFGGSARAAAETFDGKIKQLKNSFGDLMEKVGGFVVDHLQPLVGWLADLVDNLSNVTENTEILGVKLSDLKNWFIAIKDALADLLEGAQTFAEQAIDVLDEQFNELYETLRDDLIPVLERLWRDYIEPLMPVIGGAFVTAVYSATETIDNFIDSIKRTMDMFDRLKEAVNKTSNFIKIVLAPVAPLFIPIIYVVSKIVGWIEKLMERFGGLRTAIVNGMKGLSDIIIGAIFPLYKLLGWLDGILRKIGLIKGESRDVGAETRARNEALLGGPVISGTYASGGTPTIGMPSLVGEEGPELFIPNRSGTVIPADLTSSLLNSGGNNQTINVSFNGVFTGNETEFRRLAVKVFQAAEDAAMAQNNSITTQNWSRA